MVTRTSDVRLLLLSHVQYHTGLPLTQAWKRLYADGGIRRFYKVCISIQPHPNEFMQNDMLTCVGNRVCERSGPASPFWGYSSKCRQVDGCMYVCMYVNGVRAYV